MDILNNSKVKKAIELRVEAEKLKAEAAELIKQSDAYLLPLMQVTDTKTIDGKKAGKFVLIPDNKYDTIDAKTFKASLLLKGVSTKVITEAEKAATVQKETKAYVRYYKYKEEKKK